MKKGNSNQDIPDKGIRLNKYMAQSGVCSRRKADEFISQGLVTINGDVITELGTRVFAGDEVRFEGSRVRREPKVYILLNKPKGYITTTHDPKGRKTVIELVQGSFNQRLYPVGRLDRDTTGLIIITNDGNLTQDLSHPSMEVSKTYRVVLNKPLEPADLHKINKGLYLDDGPVNFDEVHVQGNQRKIDVTLHLGRNRIIRRTFEKLGYEVIELDRTDYAGLTKKNLPKGKWRHIQGKELVQLRKTAGK